MQGNLTKEMLPEVFPILDEDFELVLPDWEEIFNQVIRLKKDREPTSFYEGTW